MGWWSIVRGLIRPGLYRQAVDDYWAASTLEQERDAYARMRRYGLRPSYGER